ncbi:hypothetical protein JXC34_00330 [Candidatus Woesearchaeota archaeon]|nr:hypothetical protein [Candidatus Woesearchaeota archaeon]
MGVKELSAKLLYYKRKDVQEAICWSAKNREVGFRFAGSGFGKRPDILVYPNDVLELVKKGVSSFHISEEKWTDPLLLSPSMGRAEQDELRKGWDLVLDIDFPIWEFSKLTAHFFLRALRDHGIKSVSFKYSGNKGFHIGVPFKAFPKKIGDIYLRTWFPEGPRRITKYLLDYITKITENLIKEQDGKIIFDNTFEYSFSQLAQELNIDPKDLAYQSRCKICKKPRQNLFEVEFEYVCPKCEKRVLTKEKKKIPVCEGCGSIMNLYEHSKTRCEGCGGSEFEEINMFNPFSVIQIDTILIASRHLFRSPYSMHEKSGLVSVVISPEEIMDFDKESASPERIVINDLRFLDDSKTIPGEGKELIIKAFDYKPVTSDNDISFDEKKEYEIPQDAVPAILFPPCIQKILEGLEDGKKRSLFILTNFLASSGWQPDNIEKLLLEWNSKNKDPLRDVNITSHVRYHKQRKKRFPPPNCRKYYQDFQVCFPDRICDRIKNPLSYSKIKARYTKKQGNKKK